MIDSYGYSTNGAADFLNERIPGKTSSYWMRRLINARRTDRPQVFAIPFSMIGKVVVYQEVDLVEFAEFEKSRQLGKMKLSGRAAEVVRAFGIGTSGGSSTGRKLKVTATGITLQIDEATGKRFIRIVADDPLMVYRLEIEEAKVIVKELAEILAYCDRADAQSGEQAPATITYETVTDNASMLVRRRVEK